MYAHEYKLELQATAIIDTYHREAIRAEQRRLVQAGRPSHIATAALGHRDINLDLRSTTQGAITMFSVPVRFLSRGLSRRTTLAAQILTMVVVLVSILSVGGGSTAAQGTRVRHTSTTSAIAAGEACFTGLADCSWVDVYIGPGKVAGTTVLCLEINTGAVYE
ncbi:MAG TPA: hypothetical protein VGR29_05465, partial [Thermomicrobiales bacterium]|nr:hypothetical protein [Thermomicrobiales bacterium]